MNRQALRRREKDAERFPTLLNTNESDERGARIASFLVRLGPHKSLDVGCSSELSGYPCKLPKAKLLLVKATGLRPLSIDTIEGLEQYLASSSDYPFMAILLATEADEAITRYFKDYSDDLNQLAGETCLLLVLQPKLKPPPPSQFIIETVLTAPVNPGYAYIAARSLGVPIGKLPSLVVFESLENDVGDLAIVPIPNEEGDPIKNKLRSLISHMDECKEKATGQRLRCFKAKVRNQAIKSGAKGLLKKVLGQALSEGESKLIGMA